jgi:hypothetical protein
VRTHVPAQRSVEVRDRGSRSPSRPTI